MKTGTEIAYTYATTVKAAKLLTEEIDAAIADAVQAEREACAKIAERQELLGGNIAGFIHKRSEDGKK